MDFSPRPNPHAILPLERSARLRQEADFVLTELGVFDILGACGRVTPTGSYFLDTLIHPDIDLYVSSAPLEGIFQAAARFASHPWVKRVHFLKSDSPRLPDGLYLKPEIHTGGWGQPWKIDIWFLDDAVIESHMVEMRRFQALMTPALREQIICYKASILTAELRTPAFSGYFIYRAFLEEGLTDDSAVSDYLTRNGVKL